MVALSCPWPGSGGRPAAPVTAPVASANWIVPLLNPTSPPATPRVPMLTAPCAQEKDAPWVQTEASTNPNPLVLVIVPSLVPTRPPALFMLEVVVPGVFALTV